MGDVDLAMVHARRLELHRHPAPPAGAEVHSNGLFHEVGRGDGAIAIAREYSRAYHMDISASELRDANPTVFADGLQPGELLRIPRLTQRFDTMFLADNPNVTRVGTRLMYTVASGDSLSAIARRSNETNGTRLTWQQLYAANKATIGADPGRIRPGQQLVLPGITTASPQATLQSIAETDQDVVLTRTARVRHETGDVDSIDVVHYAADPAHATRYASVDDAVVAARAALRSDAGTAPMVVMQVRDGSIQLVPLRGSEVSDNLDDSDRTLALAYRANDRGVVAVVDERAGSDAITVRRYDR